MICYRCDGSVDGKAEIKRRSFKARELVSELNEAELSGGLEQDVSQLSQYIGELNYRKAEEQLLMISEKWNVNLSDE